MKLIGETPMIKIVYRFLGVEQFLYTKLEFYNLTGSIKDRMVEYALREAKETSALREGMILVEATSGNTGIALSAYGAFQNHPVQIFMPDWVSEERKQLMELFGAKVTLVSKQEGGFLECIQRAKKYAEEHDAYLLNQFSNPDNLLAHYYSTAEEIIEQLPKVDFFVSGIGTGGTLMGTGKRLKEVCQTNIIAMEPEKMSLLKLNTKGDHKIEGIGDEFLPELVDATLIDEVITVNDDDAIQMAQKLATELGLGVGISSGANFLAAARIKQQTEGTVVTVFPDDNKKYLSTDLAKSVPENSEFFASKIELVRYEIV